MGLSTPAQSVSTKGWDMKEECAQCTLARLVADFIRAVEAEEALASGDAEGDDWYCCYFDLLKGAGQ